MSAANLTHTTAGELTAEHIGRQVLLTPGAGAGCAPHGGVLADVVQCRLDATGRLRETDADRRVRAYCRQPWALRALPAHVHAWVGGEEILMGVAVAVTLLTPAAPGAPTPPPAPRPLAPPTR